MKLHVSRNGENLGGFDEEQLTDKLENGEITYDDYGWLEGMTEWLPLRQIVTPPAGATPQSPSVATEQPAVSIARNDNPVKYRLTENAKVYSEASNQSALVTELQAGDEIAMQQSVKNQNETWKVVILSDGRSGYIHGKTKADKISQAVLSTPLTLGKIAFSYHGRIPRATFWLALLYILVPHFFVVLTLTILSDSLHSPKIAIVGFIVWFPLVAWVSLAIQVKRWHDLGRSGWAVLINLVPVINILVILVALGMMPGEPNTNEYGASPLSGRKPGNQ